MRAERLFEAGNPIRIGRIGDVHGPDPRLVESLKWSRVKVSLVSCLRNGLV
jgi:hypothetical protein